MTGTKLITRPKLAAYLKGKGIPVELTANPFEGPGSPYQKAWFVPDTSEVNRLILEYYARGERHG